MRGGANDPCARTQRRLYSTVTHWAPSSPVVWSTLGIMVSNEHLWCISSAPSEIFSTVLTLFLLGLGTTNLVVPSPDPTCRQITLLSPSTRLLAASTRKEPREDRSRQVTLCIPILAHLMSMIQKPRRKLSHGRTKAEYLPLTRIVAPGLRYSVVCLTGQIPRRSITKML
jgi:hypothetical protein